MAADAADTAPRVDVRGDTVVLGLVLSLVAFLFVLFTVFSVNLQGDDWLALVPGVTRLAHSAFAALGLLVAFAAYRAGRNGWWLYGVGAMLPVVQFVVIGGWFLRTRDTPATVGRWTV